MDEYGRKPALSPNPPCAVCQDVGGSTGSELPVIVFSLHIQELYVSASRVAYKGGAGNSQGFFC